MGSEEYKKVDIRLIVASNKDLKEAIQEGEFREDLYYRVNVFPIHVPPLRERQEDIPVLANHFLKQYAERHRKPVSRIDPGAMGILQGYYFPGNVRELENIIETAVLMASEEEIESKDLPLQFQDGALEKSPLAVPRTNEELKEEKRRINEELERKFLIQALKQHSGKITDAAQATGMNRAMFHSLISKHSIDPREYR